HIAGLNAFPSSDGRTVESVTFFKLVFIKSRNRYGNVLFFAFEISEAQINKFDVVVHKHLHDFSAGLSHGYLLSKFGRSNQKICSTKLMQISCQFSTCTKSCILKEPQ